MNKPIHLDFSNAEAVEDWMFESQSPGVGPSFGELGAKAFRERKETPISDKRWTESLLSFKVDRETEMALEDAKADNIVYDALGEHPVLGKPKKKK